MAKKKFEKAAGKPAGPVAGQNKYLKSSSPFMRDSASRDSARKSDKASVKARAQDAEDVPYQDRIEEEGDVLTTNQGIVISDNHNSLKAGPRGPTLLEDFVLREKIMSFDHERIPERVVHARGAGAFGFFECTRDMSKYTSARFLTQVGKRTPLLTRFSTVAGSRGSADTARDVRGFAVKFYTDEGNYDLVGNNIPVFFIQDAMKFPDLIHAAKPEQDREIPQAQTAHDTFWDFMSLMPESLHMAMWIMSDRTIPRSLRMMEGFGVHTFRLVNAKGESSFVKFHWKPKLGVHSLPWEESQMLGGLDPDYHRRDLWESIDNEAFPEWELGVQIIPEKDEFKFPFDLLDPTKLIPEELVPVEIIGRMVLNRNPDNYFAEIEQVAFHPANLVPGIDLSNDPLLQGRLFSYTDTQLTRLGGPNFHELPVNRAIAPVHNNNRDGFGRQMIPKGRVAYEPNSLKGGCPFHAAMKGDPQAFVSMTEKMQGHKLRTRSQSFGDFHSQAKLFYDSQTPVEQQHIKDAFTFELSKVEVPEVRQRQVELLMLVNADLANEIAQNLGIKLPAQPSVAPTPDTPENDVVPKNRATAIAMQDSDDVSWTPKVRLPAKSAALSMIGTFELTPETRKIGILITAKSDYKEVDAHKSALEANGLVVELVVPKLNTLAIAKEYPEAERKLNGTPSHTYDAIVVMTPADGYEKPEDVGLAIRFIGQAFKHCKTISATDAGASLVDRATFGLYTKDAGVILSAIMNEKLNEGPQGDSKRGTLKSVGKLAVKTNAKADNTKVSSANDQTKRFLDSVAGHRHWEREMMAKELPY